MGPPGEVPWTQKAAPQGRGPARPAALEDGDSVSSLSHSSLGSSVPSYQEEVTWSDASSSDDRNS